MKNRKKTVKIAVSLVVVVALIASAVIFVRKQTDNRYQAVIMDVGTSTITQTLSTTGVVESMNRGEFEIFSGVVAKEVFVKLGDKVEEGQLLATFEPSSLKGLVAQKQTEYDNAKVNYYNSVSAANEAATKIPELEKQIAEYTQQIEKLSAQIEANESAETEQENVPAWVDSLDYSRLSKLLGNEYTDEQIRSYFVRLAQRGADRKSLSDLIDSMTSVGSFDVAEMLGTSSEETELMSAQLSLMGIKAQKTLLETQSQNMLGSTYKSLMETAEANLESTKAAVKKLENGWYAEGAGVISELNIMAGVAYAPVSSSSSQLDINSLLSMVSGGTDISSLLSSFTGSASTKNIGMAIEYYDSFIASFTLGKSDILDVTVGKTATIESLGREFEGEITYISPVASSSSSIDIGSMLGSLTGSSSSGGSNSIPAQVLIKNPDESIIVGIDVNIDIIVDTVEDAVVVPIEAIETNSSGSYVYKYNEDSKTVSRVEVEIGLSSDTQYQILSGVEVGDKIVQNQSSQLQEIAEEAEKVIATPYQASEEASV